MRNHFGGLIPHFREFLILFLLNYLLYYILTTAYDCITWNNKNLKTPLFFLQKIIFGPRNVHFVHYARLSFLVTRCILHYSAARIRDLCILHCSSLGYRRILHYRAYCLGVQDAPNFVLALISCFRTSRIRWAV